MKPMRLMFCVSIVLMILLAACVPASTPTPTPVVIVPASTTVPANGYIGSARRNLNHSTS